MEHKRDFNHPDWEYDQLGPADNVEALDQEQFQIDIATDMLTYTEYTPGHQPDASNPPSDDGN